MMRRGLAIGGVAVCAVAFGLPALGQEAPEKELLRRITPSLETSGVARLSSVYEVDVRMGGTCDTRTVGCFESRKFPRIYRVTFDVERRESVEGETLLERESRGRILLALEFSSDDERNYEARIDQALSELSAAAYAEPYAGTRSTFGTTEISQISVAPSFACMEDGDGARVMVFSRKTGIDESGNEGIQSAGTTTWKEGEAADRLCAELEAATETAVPVEYRTMSSPSSYEDLRLHVDGVASLPGTLYPDELSLLPAGTKVVLGEAPEGAISYSTYTIEPETGEQAYDVLRDGTLSRIESGPTDLPVEWARGHGWFATWTLERTRQRLGIAPGVDASSVEEIYSVLVPRAAPRRDGSPADEGEPVRVEIDLEQFVDLTAEALEAVSEISVEALVQAISSTATWTRSPAWTLAICMPDGTAYYWLPPASVPSRVTNPDLFCPALRRRLASGG